MAILFAPLAPHLEREVPRHHEADETDERRVERHESPDGEGVLLKPRHVDNLVPGKRAVEDVGIDVPVSGYGQVRSGQVH